MGSQEEYFNLEEIKDTGAPLLLGHEADHLFPNSGSVRLNGSKPLPQCMPSWCAQGRLYQ
jgi:hypothetical protein